MADSSVIDQMFVQNPVVDPHIRKYELARFVTNQPFSDASNPSEITIDTRNTGLDSLTLLQRSFISVQFSFRAALNAAIAANQSQLVQNGWSLFSRAILYINDAEVETVERPGFVSHLKSLVEKTADAIEGQGPVTSYYPRERSSAQVGLPNGTAPNADPMVAKNQLRYVAAGVHTVQLRLRDVFGFCTLDKPILGARISIRLQPETSMSRVIYQGPNSTASDIRLSACELIMPVVRPDNATLQRIYAEVNSGKPIPFEFERWFYYRHVMPINSLQENVVVPNSAKRPIAMHVLMQPETAETALTSDKLSGNTYSFGPNRLMVDSKQYPEVGFEGLNKGYLMEYETFLQTGGKHKSDIFGTYVDFDKWANHYPVLSYDLSAARDEFGSVRSNPAILQWRLDHAANAATAVAGICVVGKEIRHLQVVNGMLTVSAPEYAD